jgi:hypothetical protein
MVSGLGHVWVDGNLISTSQGERDLWIESKDIELDSKAHKYIDTFVAELRDAGETQARIKIGYRDRLEDPLQWTDWFSMADQDLMHWLRITTRYFRVRIEDAGAKSIWKLSALEFFGQVMGGRL